MTTTQMKAALGCAAVVVALGASDRAWAQAASAADVARLQADVARLERELRDQKELFMRMMEADRQRYDTLLQLIRQMPAGGGGGAAAAAPAPAAGGAAPQASGEPAAAGAAATGPQTTTLSGRVRLPAGSEDAYVYLEGGGPRRPRAVQIKQEGKQFAPLVTVVTVGSKISFPNTDTVFHNVFSTSPAASFDLGTIKGGETSQPVTMTQPGHVEIKCNIHSRMRADILVVPNAYFAKVKPDGSFAIANVPVGTRKVVVWGAAIKPAAQTVDVRPGASVTLAAEPAKRGQHSNKFGEAYRSYE